MATQFRLTRRGQGAKYHHRGCNPNRECGECNFNSQHFTAIYHPSGALRPSGKWKDHRECEKNADDILRLQLDMALANLENAVGGEGSNLIIVEFDDIDETEDVWGG